MTPVFDQLVSILSASEKHGHVEDGNVHHGAWIDGEQFIGPTCQSYIFLYFNQERKKEIWIRIACISALRRYAKTYLLEKSR